MAAVDNKIIASLMIRLGMDSTRFGGDIKKAKGKLDTFNTGLRQVQGAFAAAFSVYAIGNFLKTSLEAFDKQAKAVAKVTQAINTTGQAAKRTSEDLQKMASSLQRSTIFSDEDILNDVQAQLLTFTNISGEAFDRATKAALDLSTVLGTDLRQQSVQLGKALNDPITGLTALRRAGVTFSDEQRNVINKLVEENKLFEAQTLILDELARQYGGQAEVAALVGLGEIQQAKNALGDIKEIIGEMTAPVAIKSATLWKEWAAIIKSTDFSKWEKFQATISNTAKHNLYEELGIREMMNAADSPQFETIENMFEGSGFTIKGLSFANPPRPGESPVDVIKPLPPLLDEATKKLENYTEAWNNAVTEAELAEWGRKIQLQEEEIKRLKELGRVTDDMIKKQRELMALEAKKAEMWLTSKYTDRYKQAPSISGVIPFEGEDMELSDKTAKAWRDAYDENVYWQNMITQQTSDFNQTMKYFYEDIATGFGEALGQMIASGKGFDVNFLLAPIANMMANLGKLAISAGVTTLAIDKALKSGNGYAAIAAGVALVALATAVRVGMSNISQGGSGSTYGSGGGATGGSGAFSISRNLNEPVLQVEVFGELTFDSIRLSSKRGNQKYVRGYG